jgi:hypothetical protein
MLNRVADQKEFKDEDRAEEPGAVDSTPPGRGPQTSNCWEVAVLMF